MRRRTPGALLAVAALLLAPIGPAAANPPQAAVASAAVPSAELPPDDPALAMAEALTATATTSRYLGSALSGVVVDAADGTVVWGHNDGLSRMPASTLKLLTAYTVLESLDPAATFRTTTCRTGRVPGAVFVRGGGDPSLSWARLQSLAAATAIRVKQAGLTTIALHLDGSYFPAPTAAAGWQAGYLKYDVQYVRGLTLAGHRGADGRLAVGRLLVTALKKHGVTATVAGTAVTPSGCARLAETRSAPVGQLVAAMLARSDNDYAEFLLRHAALARGYPATWRGALDNEREVLVRAGVPTGGLRMADGSGLSRSNRTPVATLVAVLRLLREDPGDAPIVFAWNGLPRAGQTGTLTRRFVAPPHACARGRIQAKTGSLGDAVTLAGIAQGVDGRDRYFVLLENGLRANTSVRAAVDTLATTVVGCGPG